MSLLSPALAGGFFTTSTTWEAHGQQSLEATVHGVAQSRTRLSDLAQPYTDLGIIYNLEMISSGWRIWAGLC